MDRCPIEIWNQIFTHACTDNGFTGRSLSLVSRYIHETSKPTKLQSLSVTKPQQIHGLARLIADIPPKYRQVRHLFVASPGPSNDGDDDDLWETESSTTSAADGTAQCITEVDCRNVLDAFLHIVRAVAPTLAILYVHFPFYRKTMFLPTKDIFPSLVELTLYGSFTYGEDSLTAEDEAVTSANLSDHFPQIPSLDLTLYHDGPFADDYDPSNREEGHATSANPSDHSPQFPSLRRLHLADFYEVPAQYFGLITSVAPSLTHLCLPYKSIAAESLLAGLGTRAISSTHNPNSPSDSYPIATGALPSTIEMVLIDSGPPVDRIGWCGTGIMQHFTALNRFRQVIKEDNRIYLIKERLNEAKDAERYWLDRIEGNAGSWAVSPSQLAPGDDIF